MLLKSIKVSNFKSFDEMEIEFKRFNILIGANASGKSNFISIFQFLKNSLTYGLDNAISMEGGVDFLRNINLGAKQNLSIELLLEFGEYIPAGLSGTYGFRVIEKPCFIFTKELRYKLSIEFPTKTSSYRIAEERIEFDCFLIRSDRSLSVDEDVTYQMLEEKKEEIEMKMKSERIDGTYVINRNKDTNKINVDLIPSDESMCKIPELMHLTHMSFPKLSPKVLFLEKIELIMTPTFVFIGGMIRNFFENISIYDFDPKLMKKPTWISGKTELEPDGANLAIVLKSILDVEEKKRTLSNLMKDLLPYIDELTVEKMADKYLLTSLKESYSEKKFLPAPFLSDGTMNITALLIALYFEKKGVNIIEEPERNVHPALISRIVSMMKEASEKKQIIVSTHNPELIKYADLSDLMLISRDKKTGFSTIQRPEETEWLKGFLEEIGLDQLYIDGLLGV